jgi:hypothetical protein
MAFVVEQLKRAWRRLRGNGGGGDVQLDRRVEEHGWPTIYVGDYRIAPTWARQPALYLPRAEG